MKVVRGQKGKAGSLCCYVIKKSRLIFLAVSNVFSLLGLFCVFPLFASPLTLSMENGLVTVL